MNYRKLEKLGVELSVLGFGCMRFPTTEDGKIEREEATAMLDYAYKNGVNYFDTAWPYHAGESELFVGDVMSRYPRDTFRLATKMPVWLCKTNEDLDKIFNEQLSHLKTEYIDFYLLHALGKERFELCKSIDAINWLDAKKKEGKVKFAGFSFHDDIKNINEILDAYNWDFVQIQHNFIDNEHIQSGELYKEITARGIPVLVMEPVRGGHLAELPEDVSNMLKEVSPDRSMAAWALQWVATQQNIMVTLSGMSTLDQVKENVRVFSEEVFTLNNNEMEAVAKAAEKLLSYKTVPCTACRYCMPCPFGVNIPKMFEIYNRYEMFQNDEFGRRDYYGPMMDLDSRADKCKNCGACLEKCPQHINIPERLAHVHSVMSTLE